MAYPKRARVINHFFRHYMAPNQLFLIYKLSTKISAVFSGDGIRVYSFRFLDTPEFFSSRFANSVKHVLLFVVCMCMSVVRLVCYLLFINKKKFC